MSPTPRYQAIPRWGLVDRIAPEASSEQESKRTITSPVTVRAFLLAATAIFVVAALAHLLRYFLMLINRTTLLSPWVAIPALLMGVLAGLAAIAAALVINVVMASWLIGRRREAFGRYGQDDPRPEWALWVGCLVPVANLFWAPVFVLELAQAEQVRQRLNKPVIVWWIAWAISTLISVSATVFSIWVMWTHSGDKPQTVADNTVTTIVAYLAGFLALLALGRVFDGFVGKPEERPTHRWVVVPEGYSDRQPHPGEFEANSGAESDEVDFDEADSDESAIVVESKDREPAA